MVISPNSQFELETRPILVCFSLRLLTAQAQLAVSVSPPKVTGQKTVVLLTMQNEFTNAVQSARAACFLIDDRGQMVSQSTKWVIGENKSSLAPGATGKFNFVITSPRPITSTNLTAQLAFSRLVLDNGQQPDVRQSVVVTAAAK